MKVENYSRISVENIAAKVLSKYTEAARIRGFSANDLQPENFFPRYGQKGSMINVVLDGDMYCASLLDTKKTKGYGRYPEFAVENLFDTISARKLARKKSFLIKNESNKV